MGKTLSAVPASIEIMAPPDTVRAVFLDFACYKQWHPSWDVRIVDSSKEASKLEKGDRLKVKMHGMPINPIILENSANCFTWGGNVWGILDAAHYFTFAPSQQTPGATTFTQSEDFWGLLASITPTSWTKQDKPSQNWTSFNQDLKREVEKTSSEI